MAGAVNNKDLAPLAIYKERYRFLAPAETSLRTGARFDSGRSAFVLRVLGHEIRAAWPEFSLAPEAACGCPAALLSGEASILLIRYLLEGALIPPSGAFLPYRELPWGAVYDRNFQGRCLARLARAFGPRPDAFEAACVRLGGVRAAAGDISFDLEFLPGLAVRLILWTGDDEFSPSSQILFSDNFPSAFTAEDAAVLCEVVIRALRETV